MARRRSRTLTDVELELMQVVWPAGEATTGDIQEALHNKGRELTDGSIRKVLSILARKGYLTRRKEGKGFLYRATVPQDQARRSLVKHLLERAFDGSAEELLVHMFRARDLSRADLANIRRLLDEMEGRAK